MTPAEKLAYYQKKAQFASREKELANKAKSPVVSPELRKASFDAYRKLPRDRQLLLKQLMKVSCVYCEKQFNVPNVGKSHGLCERHRQEQFKLLGQAAPPSRSTDENRPVDLSKLTDEERKLAVNLFAIIQKSRSEKQ